MRDNNHQQNINNQKLGALERRKIAKQRIDQRR